METITGFINSLSPDESAACDGPITVDECRAAIQTMEDNKAPGSDGLTREFYSRYFHLFEDSFVEMLNSAYSGGLLSGSQRFGLITLACKDETKADSLNNWRPISLLNVDYKILSKVLSKRVASVLAECVNADQTCSVPGRSIGDNLHLIRRVVDYCNQKDAIISYDQAKAIDMVSLEYLLSVLRAYGFGESLIKWVALLYSEVNSSVIVNGWVGEKFPVGRSVRQGCPLSALLYVLCIEPLAEALRREKEFNGLKVRGQDIRLSQNADDLNTVVTTERSIEATLKWFVIYGRASGARLNQNKCRGLWLGGWRSRVDTPHDFIWSTTAKIYGVYFGAAEAAENSKMLVAKVKKMANFYCGRWMTLEGRTRLTNVVMCAQLWYVGSYVIIPDATVRELNKIIFTFIWRTQNTERNDSVSRKTTIGPPLQGGLGITDIVTKLDSLACAHMRRLVLHQEVKWRELAIYWTGVTTYKYGQDFHDNAKPRSLTPSPFYKKAIDALKRVHVKAPKLTIDGCTARATYRALLDSEKPRIEIARPELHYPTVWRNVCNRIVSPDARELNFRIAHGVLPVKDYLHKVINKYLYPSNACPFCRRPETLEHRFYECWLVRPLWQKADSIITASSGAAFTTPPTSAVFPADTQLTDRRDSDLFAIISGELREAIWIQRNRAAKERINITQRDIERLFKHRLRLRIKADFLRWPRLRFKDVWCRGPGRPLAATTDGVLCLNI
jgi:hypothetical protein